MDTSMIPDPVISDFNSEPEQFGKVTKRCSFEDFEQEAVRDVDFTKGFDSWRFRFAFEDIAAVDDNHVLEFKTTTWLPNSSRKTVITWRLRYESPPASCNATSWIGLELLTKAIRPFPVLCRMVMWNENDGKPCFEWGEMVIFRPSFDQVIWCVLDGGKPDQFSMLDKESKRRMKLHLFLDIPFSYCMALPTRGEEVIPPRFNLDNESDAIVRKFANVFETMVIGCQESEESEDEDDLCVPQRGYRPVDFMPTPDITIKVIDREKKTDRLFPCHQIVLPIRCRYFRNLLQARVRGRHGSSRSSIVNEEHIDRNGVIEIDDVDAETMVYILRYLYSGCLTRISKYDEASCDLDQVIKITAAAIKFGLDQWKAYCLSILLFDYVDDQSRMVQLQKLPLDQLKSVCTEQLATCAYVRMSSGDMPLSIPDGNQMGLRKSWKLQGGDVSLTLKKLCDQPR